MLDIKYFRSALQKNTDFTMYLLCALHQIQLLILSLLCTSSMRCCPVPPCNLFDNHCTLRGFHSKVNCLCYEREFPRVLPGLL
jgi:hypothetical protein